MNSCIFCKIINREIVAPIIAEDENVIVIMSLENHPLVIPKKHIENIYTLDSITGGDIMNELVKTANAVKRALNCEGVNITQANGSAAGQSVFHLHFHIYPRWKDQIMNQVEVVDKSERQITSEKIQSCYLKS